ncbi:hypothetical protein LJB42_000574 [Komagataella kurtzmanii]|nr:hypothetical protein LJB42_000574 [Komagataella kurtzmanii]
MSERQSVLSVGSHPNLAFYNWRLFKSTICDLTIVSSDGPTVQWYSKKFGNSRFTSSSKFTSLDQVFNSGVKLYDMVIVSASSLDELSSICTDLRDFAKRQIQSTGKAFNLLVESTNYVNLEPFIKLTLQEPEVKIFSIMSDFDIRSVKKNTYKVCDSKKESELVYVGKSDESKREYEADEVVQINKISDLYESCEIDVYKLGTPLEFLSYQWKFALPKISIEPLSIIFEQPFPKDLHGQMLAKPLISGLIMEVITVIKAMGCKLFKSYDNEDSLIERLCQLYPSVPLTDDLMEAPKLFYDFYHQNELSLDLLLLQPILLADDNKIRTPYLEFLYAIMSQFSSINTNSTEKSMLWLRKNPENLNSLRAQHEEVLRLRTQLKEAESAPSKQPDEAQTNGRDYKQFQQPHPVAQNAPIQPPSADVGPEEELEELAGFVGAFGDSPDIQRQANFYQQRPPVGPSRLTHPPPSSQVGRANSFVSQMGPNHSMTQLPPQNGPYGSIPTNRSLGNLHGHYQSHGYVENQYDQYGNVIKKSRGQYPNNSHQLPPHALPPQGFPNQRFPVGAAPQGYGAPPLQQSFGGPTPPGVQYPKPPVQRRVSSVPQMDYAPSEAALGSDMARFPQKTNRKNRQSTLPNLGSASAVGYNGNDFNMMPRQKGHALNAKASQSTLRQPQPVSVAPPVNHLSHRLSVMGMPDQNHSNSATPQSRLQPPNRQGTNSQSHSSNSQGTVTPDRDDRDFTDDRQYLHPGYQNSNPELQPGVAAAGGSAAPTTAGAPGTETTTGSEQQQFASKPLGLNVHEQKAESDKDKKKKRGLFGRKNKK